MKKDKQRKLLKGLAIGLLSVATLGTVVVMTNQSNGWINKLVNKTQETIDVNYREKLFKADYLNIDEYDSDVRYGRFTFTAIESIPFEVVSADSIFQYDDGESGKHAVVLNGNGSTTYSSVKFNIYSVSKVKLIVSDLDVLYLNSISTESKDFYTSPYLSISGNEGALFQTIEFNIGDSGEYVLTSNNTFAIHSIEIID